MGVDEKITLWLPGEPLAKARPRVSTHGTYTPKTTRHAQDLVRVAARLALGPPRRRALPIPTLEELCVTMHFFRGNRARRDLDNMAKLVMDALEGLLWENDVQIVEMHLTQEWVRHVPGTLLVVERARPVDPAWEELAARAGRHA